MKDLNHKNLKDLEEYAIIRKSSNNEKAFFPNIGLAGKSFIGRDGEFGS